MNHVDGVQPVTGGQLKDRRRGSESPRNRIHKKVLIKASAEVVFKALTDARELSRWFCDRATCDAREGGELVASWKAGKSSRKGRAVITRFIPGGAVDLLWIDDGTGAQEEGSRHTISYDLRSRSGLTEVVMLDADDSIPDEETFAFLDEGWNSVLFELKDYCERRERSQKLRPAPRVPSAHSAID